MNLISSLTNPTDLLAHFESLLADLDAMIAESHAACIDDNLEPTNINLARMISSDALESACSRIDSPFLSNNFLPESTYAPFSDIMICDFLFAALIMNRLNCTPADICYYY